ncbi:hypothetical protein ASD62_03655 [Phycicoccus sp. Root563]|uniref:hypothetical protein n=1 Tax=Phycicoccus sp. Root563 TaxID=1736562 RepID=UPI0007026B61|nr:hypothetical protein [Phycicoccus sp. Root563]KQZ88542.1 hypothetical protein ASD62_03655 [Phycicoccus sp. Root563]
MRDTFTARISSLAVIVAALSTLGAVIYLSVRGQQVNEYLAGLAGLTIGALLPSPLSPSGATTGATGTSSGATSGATSGAVTTATPGATPAGSPGVATGVANGGSRGSADVAR